MTSSNPFDSLGDDNEDDDTANINDNESTNSDLCDVSVVSHTNDDGGFNPFGGDDVSNDNENNIDVLSTNHTNTTDDWWGTSTTDVTTDATTDAAVVERADPKKSTTNPFAWGDDEENDGNDNNDAFCEKAEKKNAFKDVDFSADYNTSPTNSPNPFDWTEDDHVGDQSAVTKTNNESSTLEDDKKDIDYDEWPTSSSDQDKQISDKSLPASTFTNPFNWANDSDDNNDEENGKQGNQDLNEENRNIPLSSSTSATPNTKKNVAGLTTATMTAANVLYDFDEPWQMKWKDPRLVPVTSKDKEKHESLSSTPRTNNNINNNVESQSTPNSFFGMFDFMRDIDKNNFQEKKQQQSQEAKKEMLPPPLSERLCSSAHLTLSECHRVISALNLAGSDKLGLLNSTNHDGKDGSNHTKFSQNVKNIGNEIDTEDDDGELPGNLTLHMRSHDESGTMFTMSIVSLGNDSTSKDATKDTAIVAQDIYSRTLQWPGSTNISDGVVTVQCLALARHYKSLRPPREAQTLKEKILNQNSIGDYRTQTQKEADALEVLHLIGMSLGHKYNDGDDDNSPWDNIVDGATATNSTKNNEEQNQALSNSIKDADNTSNILIPAESTNDSEAKKSQQLLLSMITTDGNLYLFDALNVLTSQSNNTSTVKSEDNQDLHADFFLSNLLGDVLHNHVESSIYPLTKPISTIPLTLCKDSRSDHPHCHFVRDIASQLWDPHNTSVGRIRDDNSLSNVSKEVENENEKKIDNTEQIQFPKILLPNSIYRVFIGNILRLEMLDSNIEPTSSSNQTQLNIPTCCVSSSGSSLNQYFGMLFVGGIGIRQKKLGGGYEEGGWITIISLQRCNETKSLFLPHPVKALYPAQWDGHDFVFALCGTSDRINSSSISSDSVENCVLAIRVDSGICRVVTKKDCNGNGSGDTVAGSVGSAADMNQQHSHEKETMQRLLKTNKQIPKLPNISNIKNTNNMFPKAIRVRRYQPIPVKLDTSSMLFATSSSAKTNMKQLKAPPRKKVKILGVNVNCQPPALLLSYKIIESIPLSSLSTLVDDEDDYSELVEIEKDVVELHSLHHWDNLQEATLAGMAETNKIAAEAKADPTVVIKTAMEQEDEVKLSNNETLKKQQHNDNANPDTVPFEVPKISRGGDGKGGTINSVFLQTIRHLGHYSILDARQVMVKNTCGDADTIKTQDVDSPSWCIGGQGWSMVGGAHYLPGAYIVCWEGGSPNTGSHVRRIPNHPSLIDKEINVFDNSNSSHIGVSYPTLPIPILSTTTTTTSTDRGKLSEQQHQLKNKGMDKDEGRCDASTSSAYPRRKSRRERSRESVMFGTGDSRNSWDSATFSNMFPSLDPQLQSQQKETLFLSQSSSSINIINSYNNNAIDWTSSGFELNTTSITEGGEELMIFHTVQKLIYRKQQQSTTPAPNSRNGIGNSNSSLLPSPAIKISQLLSRLETSDTLLKDVPFWKDLDGDDNDCEAATHDEQVIMAQCYDTKGALSLLTMRLRAVSTGIMASPFDWVLSWLCGRKDYFTAALIALNLLEEWDVVHQLCVGMGSNVRGAGVGSDRGGEGFVSKNSRQPTQQNFLHGILAPHITNKSNTLSEINNNKSINHLLNNSRNDSYTTTAALADMAVGCLIKGGIDMSVALELFLQHDIYYNAHHACNMLAAMASRTIMPDYDPEGLRRLVSTDRSPSSPSSSYMSLPSLGDLEGWNKKERGRLLWPVKCLLKVAVARKCIRAVLVLMNAVISEEMRVDNDKEDNAKNDGSTDINITGERSDEPSHAADAAAAMVFQRDGCNHHHHPQLCTDIVSLIIASLNHGARHLLDIVNEDGVRYWQSISHHQRMKLSTLQKRGRDVGPSYGLFSASSSSVVGTSVYYPMLREAEIRDWALQVMGNEIRCKYVSSDCTSHDTEQRNDNCDITIPTEWLQIMCIACLSNADCQWESLLAQSYLDPITLGGDVLNDSVLNNVNHKKKEHQEEEVKQSQQQLYNDGLEEHIRSKFQIRKALLSGRNKVYGTSFSNSIPQAGELDFDLLIAAMLLLDRRSSQSWFRNDHTITPKKNITTQVLLNAICEMAGREGGKKNQDQQMKKAVPAPENVEDPRIEAVTDLVFFNGSQLMTQCANAGNVEAAGYLLGGKDGLFLRCCNAILKASASSLSMSIEDAEKKLHQKMKRIHDPHHQSNESSSGYVSNDDIAAENITDDSNSSNHQLDHSLSSFILNEGQKLVLHLLDEFVFSVTTYSQFETKRGGVDPVEAARLCLLTWLCIEEGPKELKTSEGGKIERDEEEINHCIQSKDNHEIAIPHNSIAPTFLMNWIRVHLDMMHNESDKFHVAESIPNEKKRSSRLACAVLTRVLLWPTTPDEKMILAEEIKFDLRFLVQLSRKSCGLVECLPPWIIDSMDTSSSSSLSSLKKSLLPISRDYMFPSSPTTMISASNMRNSRNGRNRSDVQSQY